MDLRKSKLPVTRMFPDLLITLFVGPHRKGASNQQGTEKTQTALYVNVKQRVNNTRL